MTGQKFADSINDKLTHGAVTGCSYDEETDTVSLTFSDDRPGQIDLFTAVITGGELDIQE